MEFKGKQSIYIQITNYVCEQILLEQWPPGERIPSVRDLAATLEVDPNTVMRAYDFMQSQEIIFNKRGIGYSAAADAKKLILAYRRERFLESELPGFFKILYLLNIPVEELQTRYDKFVAAEYPTTP